ncbi:MAG: hypothetical protein KDI71_17810 [Xanthomonadales bacterium]|nr:hypothetical protein [Xanthomonadales bacterium]
MKYRGHPSVRNVPCCRQCGFWLEDGENVIDGKEKGMVAMLVVILLSLVCGYLFGLSAAMVVGLLGFIFSLPLTLNHASSRWYCFRCERYFRSHQANWKYGMQCPPVFRSAFAERTSGTRRNLAPGITRCPAVRILNTMKPPELPSATY